MSRTTYRITVVLCALSWFLVGMHFPVVHAFTHEGAPRPWLVLGLTGVFLVMGSYGLWLLLRRGTSTDRDAPAT